MASLNTDYSTTVVHQISTKSAFTTLYTLLADKALITDVTPFEIHNHFNKMTNTWENLPDNKIKFTPENAFKGLYKYATEETNIKAQDIPLEVHDVYKKLTQATNGVFDLFKGKTVKISSDIPKDTQPEESAEPNKTRYAPDLFTPILKI